MQAGLEVDLQVVKASELEGAVRAAVPAGIVAVGGGDGILSGAAAALLRAGATLVPVPVGTLQRERAIAGIWIGLGRGSFRLPGDAEPIAARNLEVVIAPGRTRLRLVTDAIRAVATLRRGDPPHRTGLEMLHAPVVTLTSAGPLDLARDGEAERVEPPVTAEVLRGALEVRSLEPLRPPDPPVHGPHEP